MDHEQLNVLVIDDEEGVRTLLSDIVRRGEHQVVAVESAEEGLELLPLWSFQVAFIDQELPGIQGLVLGEYLRRSNPDMTIALVTGATDRGLFRRSRDLAIKVIPKPFVVDDIIKVIDDYLAGARSRRELRMRKADPDYAPQFARQLEDVTQAYGMPNIPSRVQRRLVDGIKRSLNNLRSVGRYTERDRIVALTGLLTAAVLDIDLPRASSGLNLFEEYDELMSQQGRRPEFEGGAVESIRFRSPGRGGGAEAD